MPTDLAIHVASSPLVDTHNELKKEPDWVERGPDILGELFDFVGADLHVSRAVRDGLKQFRDRSNPDIAGRFRAIQGAWDLVRHTGYGEGASLIASEFYGMDEITPESLAAAQEKRIEYRAPGARYDLLRNRANLDHIQTDDKRWACLPDASGPEFFLYDISWSTFCNGQVDPAAINSETGVTVRDLATLEAAMEAIFAKYGGFAIAVKSTHIFKRTFRWEQRTQGDVRKALDQVLSKKRDVPEEVRLCLGDWCWEKGIHLATRYGLPFKMHTGTFAGTGSMSVDRINAGNLCPLLLHFQDARFVLMHIAYPYSDELIALTKHFHNVWADMCWAWSLNPFHSTDFVRRFIHGAPISKLFLFGGDSYWPTMTAANAIQARRGFTRALDAEVAEGLLTEKQAIFIADRLMMKNQYDCFDVEGTRQAIKEGMKKQSRDNE